MGDEPVPDEQDDQRVEGGADKSRALIKSVPADGLPDERREERAGDSEHRGQMNPVGLLSPRDKNRAMIPARKPITPIQRILDIAPSLRVQLPHATRVGRW